MDDIIKKQLRQVEKSLRERNSHEYVVSYNFKTDDLTRPRLLLMKGTDSGQVEKEFKTELGWQTGKLDRLSIHRKKFEDNWW
jgi:hypothetical protein